MEFTIQDIRLAEKKDIVDWMNLMRLVIDGYPVMDEDDYLASWKKVLTKSVTCAKGGRYSHWSYGIYLFSRQYRISWRTSAISKSRTSKVILGCLIGNISSRAGNQHNNLSRQDKADTGHRDMLLQLGFAEKELLTEFGYPTQRFVLPPKKQEAIQHG